ncbi:MAG: hypothetical protein M1358_22335 [Chloroflexi bacterium]|nr:hypothetical protein [Chloroflexota bacterium]
MIVRISTEGQYRLPSGYLDKLNELDNQLVDVVAQGDENKFQKLLERMLKMVRDKGQPLKADELVGSEIILPPPGTTIEDARALFTGDGLIPG